MVPAIRSTTARSTSSARLINDIALTESWTPIGDSGSHKFSGSFDGNGYTISGLSIVHNDPDGEGDVRLGLFGYVGGTTAAPAEIKNLTVKGSISAAAADISVGGLIVPREKQRQNQSRRH